MATAGIDALAGERRVLDDGCGLIDRSARGKLALTGGQAIEFLNGQVTNELEDLRPGEGRYAAFLTHKGKMLGDLRILLPAGSGDAEILLDTERAALQALFDMIRRYRVGYDAELHKRTLERGLLSLIGPRADRVAGLAEGALPQTEHANVQVHIGEVSALAIRTDTGIDLLCDAADTQRLQRALLDAGAVAVSDEAAECLRIERGRPRYGIDLDESVIPQEAGLNERAVSFTKGCYLGQETVARLFYRGKPNRHLRGLRLSRPASSGEEVHFGERVVGTITSATVSPAFGAIALALLRREAEPGAEVLVGAELAPATVATLPFA
jgi:tRNA-modifying protein YgfZ